MCVYCACLLLCPLIDCVNFCCVSGVVKDSGYFTLKW